MTEFRIPLQPEASAAYWREHEPNGHSVQIYDDDAFLLDGLTRFAGAALGAGDPFIIIATPEHRAVLEARLSANGLDLSAAARANRYVPLDARETLSRFMVHGHPDRALFMGVAGGAITRAAEAASEMGRYVAAYGEMVALLWAEGNSRGALELEALWNELARSYAFYLHCAYPTTLFVGVGDAAPLAAICAEHSHVAFPEDEPHLDSDARGETISMVQQQARVLTAELRERGRRLR